MQNYFNTYITLFTKEGGKFTPPSIDRGFYTLSIDNESVEITGRDISEAAIYANTVANHIRNSKGKVTQIQLNTIKQNEFNNYMSDLIKVKTII